MSAFAQVQAYDIWQVVILPWTYCNTGVYLAQSAAESCWSSFYTYAKQSFIKAIALFIFFFKQHQQEIIATLVWDKENQLVAGIGKWRDVKDILGAHLL